MSYSEKIDTMKQQFSLKLREEVHRGNLNTEKPRFANYGGKMSASETISSKSLISSSGKLSRLGLTGQEDQ